MDYLISPLTAERWPALEDLFGRAGASNGCWCGYWRIGPRYRDRPCADNKRDLRRLAASGRPPGLLAFDGELAVGWCEPGPRAELAWLTRARFLTRADDLPVWPVPCFFLRRAYRRRRGDGSLDPGRRRRGRRGWRSRAGGLPSGHHRAWLSRQPVSRGRAGLRPARLPGHRPAQARPSGDATPGSGGRYQRRPPSRCRVLRSAHAVSASYPA